MIEFYWFLLGMREFLSEFTSNPGEYIEIYDVGRDFAHRITMRKFEL